MAANPHSFPFHQNDTEKLSKEELLYFKALTSDNIEKVKKLLDSGKISSPGRVYNPTVKEFAHTYEVIISVGGIQKEMATLLIDKGVKFDDAKCQKGFLRRHQSMINYAKAHRDSADENKDIIERLSQRNMLPLPGSVYEVTNTKAEEERLFELPRVQLRK